MPTSGTIAFSVNRDDVITAAMQSISAIGDAETPSGSDIETCSFWLNLLVKQWSGTKDFAPGLKMWSRKTGYCFLSSTTGTFQLGNGGDNWTGAYNQTLLTAAGSAGGYYIAVASATGIVAGYNIGIQLDDGSLQWTTVVSITNLSVRLAATLNYAASSGNVVFCYQTKSRRPMTLLTVVLRDINLNDTPIWIGSLQDYEAVAQKSQMGDPTFVYYQYAGDPSLPGTLYTDTYSIDVSKVLRIIYLSDIEDLNAATDTVDYSPAWYLPLALNLGLLLAPVFRLPITDDMRRNAAVALAVAQSETPDYQMIYFQPDRVDLGYGAYGMYP